MTTSTRDSHEINIEPEGLLLIIEVAKQELNFFEKQMMKWSIFQLTPWPVSIPIIPSARIGPFYQQNFLQVAFKKSGPVLRFLLLINKPLEYVMMEMREVVEELRAHYSFLEDMWRNDAKFVQLMVYDGCRILGLLRDHDERSLLYDRYYGTHKASHRPIPELQAIVLLDNQVPLLAVKMLLQVEARSRNKRPPVS